MFLPEKIHSSTSSIVGSTIIVWLSYWLIGPRHNQSWNMIVGCVINCQLWCTFWTSFRVPAKIFACCWFMANTSFFGLEANRESSLNTWGFWIWSKIYLLPVYIATKYILDTGRLTNSHNFIKIKQYWTSKK